MNDFKNIKSKIVEMSRLILKMWQETFLAFMEHGSDRASSIMEKENRINDLEKEITADLIEFSKAASKKVEKDNAAIYAAVVGDLELIGDYCKDLLERIEIKIAENLLFSEEALAEYKELYQITENALEEVVHSLEKNEACFAKGVLKKEFEIDKLVDKYRKKHTLRLIEGICDVRSGNMFLNMLDFNAAAYHHIKKISRQLIKLH
ncbi:MAG: Na/Pi cotransporter family protein [Candidatus Omnitrophica bacterium]|nr:Na/Pi cotransporter family protein [Candidatus Omnitrophota bacterium]